jgi:transposase
LKTRAEQRIAAPVKVVTIHEVGLDGFWIHRLLDANGVESHVVDPASIAVPRRHRRAKTDAIRWRDAPAHADGLAARRAAGLRHDSAAKPGRRGPPSRTGDGRSVPARLKAELLREIDRLELVLRQISEVEAERDEMLRPAEASSPAALLVRLKGIGAEFATVLP